MNVRLKQLFDRRGPASNFAGFTLFELVVTLTVLSILVVGTVPLVTNAIKRQREERLRESLRMIRLAIDEFRRDTVGACPLGAVSTGNPIARTQSFSSDPRSRVVIDDCTIFDTENLDRYPPTLEVLVDGIAVRPRGLNILGGNGRPFGTVNATDLNDATEEILKVYMREIPVDPMTGDKDWELRSCYQTKDDDTWDNVNVFDVRSASKETGLNGVKYSDW